MQYHRIAPLSNYLLRVYFEVMFFENYCAHDEVYIEVSLLKTELNLEQFQQFRNGSLYQILEAGFFVICASLAPCKMPYLFEHSTDMGY